MFLNKIDELFNSVPNVSDITDEILIAGFDKQDKDNNQTLKKVLWIFKQANLKVKKDKCLFKVQVFPSLGI